MAERAAELFRRGEEELEFGRLKVEGTGSKKSLEPSPSGRAVMDQEGTWRVLSIVEQYRLAGLARSTYIALMVGVSMSDPIVAERKCVDA